MKYDLSKIMRRAWKLFRKGGVSFGEALHRSWLSTKAEPVNAKRIEAAKAEAGISEAVNTWSGWRDAGYEVQHGSKAVFKTDLIWATKGDGAVYRASFFSASQVQPLAA